MGSSKRTFGFGGRNRRVGTSRQELYERAKKLGSGWSFPHEHGPSGSEGKWQEQ
jgi:hypothetical protein